MRPARPKQEQILVWCGVVAQLQRTRANRILREQELPYPLFVLLRHFCHDPDREWTVSELTAAFETEQPGMTKKVGKLVKAGLLRTRVDDLDRRRRWLSVTPAGVRMRDRLTRMLEPDREQVFGGWKQKEITELHRLLDRLRSHLDLARDTVIVPSPRSRGGTRRIQSGHR